VLLWSKQVQSFGISLNGPGSPWTSQCTSNLRQYAIRLPRACHMRGITNGPSRVASDVADQSSGVSGLTTSLLSLIFHPVSKYSIDQAYDRRLRHVSPRRYYLRLRCNGSRTKRRRQSDHHRKPPTPLSPSSSPARPTSRLASSVVGACSGTTVLALSCVAPGKFCSAAIAR